MTQYSIGHLKTFCMSILSLSGGIESEWKRCSVLKNRLAFEYECNLNLSLTLSLSILRHKIGSYFAMSVKPQDAAACKGVHPSLS